MITMRSRVTMIYDLGCYHEGKVIAEIQKESKSNVKLFYPISKFLEPKWSYK